MNNAPGNSVSSEHTIILPAFLQVIMYGGDRFLAANIESIRAAASAQASEPTFRIRAHLEASRLNPCHEDNYWLGNAALSWGGAEEEGFQLLRSAMHCRFWDEWPAFFYGFNQHFFNNNIEEARWAIEVAAQRSEHNAAVFRNFAIMLAAGKIDNTRMAIEMIEREREQTNDPKLKEMLEQRAMRLRGLQTLREAQAEFEATMARKLTHPSELVELGLINDYPVDPLGIGYEFSNQAFHLRQLQIR